MKSTVEHLKQGILHIVANGHHGRTDFETQNSVKWWEEPEGRYKFEMDIKFDNEPADYLHGTLEGRRIKFIRTRIQTFIQEYEGYLFEGPDAKGRAEMAGTFTHNEAPGYAWYGYTVGE